MLSQTGGTALRSVKIYVCNPVESPYVSHDLGTFMPPDFPTQGTWFKCPSPSPEAETELPRPTSAPLERWGERSLEDWVPDA